MCAEAMWDFPKTKIKKLYENFLSYVFITPFCTSIKKYIVSEKIWDIEKIKKNYWISI